MDLGYHVASKGHEAMGQYGIERAVPVHIAANKSVQGERTPWPLQWYSWKGRRVGHGTLIGLFIGKGEREPRGDTAPVVSSSPPFGRVSVSFAETWAFHSAVGTAGIGRVRCRCSLRRSINDAQDPTQSPTF